jgi:hypothetical protein
MIVDSGRERLSLLTSVSVCCSTSRFLCSSGPLRNIRCCPSFVGPQVVPTSAAANLVSLAQFIQLAIHERLLVGCLSEMRKRRSVFYAVDFRIKLLRFFFFPIDHQMVLKSGLNSLVFSVSSSLSVHSWGSNIIWPPKTSFDFGVLRALVHFLSFHLQYFHLFR